MAVMVRAQNLRILAKVMQPAFQENDYGDPSQQTFTPLGNAYIEVEPLSGRHLVDARQVHAEASLRVRMRFLKGVTAACRLEWYSGAQQHTRTLEIVVVMNAEERDTMWTLLCRELPNG
jgi:head-tail adaptor